MYEYQNVVLSVTYENSIKQLKGLIDNSGNVCLIERKVLLIDYENSVKQ